MAAAILPLGPAALAQRAGATHALLVGINAYSAKPLHGCINDVDLLERTLRPMTASVTVLRDAEATRAAFDRAWSAVAGRCRAGDRLIFAFSGHGMRVARRPGDAGPNGSGLDDLILFQPYHPVRGPGEILTNSEIEQRFAMLGRAGVSVVFIADCCHSGLLTRGIDPAAAAQRTTRTATGVYSLALITQGMASLPPPPPPARPVELEQVHFFAACQPWEEVPEIPWQGRKHGALSVAISAGLEGAADADRDGRITVRELGDYVVSTVRGVADVRQTPEAKIGPRAPAVLREVMAPAPDFAPEGHLPSVRLRIDGPVPAALPSGTLRVIEGGEFDLLWRPAQGQTVSALGDVVADKGVTTDALPASIERVRAVARLQALVAVHPLELRLEREDQAQPGNETVAYVTGTRLRLVAEAITEPNLALFNIAGDGTMELLYPRKPGEAPRTPPGGRFTLDTIWVHAPYGTDRPVAVTSSQDLVPLVEALRDLHGRREPAAAVAAMEQATAGGRWQVGLAGIFTKER